MVALFRPGPMDFIPGYIKRMHGEEQVVYRHPWLEDIFKETYGYPVYQEQLMFAAMKLASYTAPEADDLRKAIAKKIREKLEAHRQKFIDGSVRNGIHADTAAAIFDDWEEFARYGFNKSHAVDYGVIAVQTAFLKLHYPVEYMTALLSVSKNDTAKVALYVADARRMGVPVEPPDINASQWDFAIEDRPGQPSVIRFGLGAVKNVGQGAVEAMLQARQNGRFANLNDFARRVDLRQVGRRALECLTKVGALDSFGPRTAILEALDRMIAVSTAHFRALETGQLSLFGAHSGVVEEISLPSAKNQVSRREVLSWERELIGLYISDHPLSPVMNELADVVTHYSGQLAEAAHQEVVRVAGIVARLRPHQTKTGKSMAFVTLEDLQGSIELVVFPRTWEKFIGLLTVDRIVLVDGKVDAQGGEPKVLVDSVAVEFTRKVSAEAEPAPASGWANPARPAARKPAFASQPEPDLVEDAPVAWEDVPPEPEMPPWEQDWKLDLTEASADFAPEAAGQGAGEPEPLGERPEPVPPLANQVPATDQPSRPEPNATNEPQEGAVPAEDLPDWGDLSISDDEEGEPARLSIPTLKGLPHLEPAAQLLSVKGPTPPPLAAGAPPAEPEASPSEPPAPSQPPPVINPPARRPASADPLSERPVGMPPYLVSPTPVEQQGESRMVTVVLRSSGDKTRDVLRLRRIHGILMSYPGEDRFALQVYERGRFFLLEFPNFSCGICQELLDRLSQLVGRENLRVESLRYQ
jgi:DNA polymerase-3 subunit alpha